MKTVGVSMKPRIYVKKLDEFFSGNKRLNCCGNRVKQDGGHIGLGSGEFLRRQRSLLFFFYYYLFFTSIRVSRPCQTLNIFLKNLKREERCEIRFTSAGKLLQGLKSQHIMKKSSLIDKLSIVLLPKKRLETSDFQTQLRCFCFLYKLMVDYQPSFSFCSTMQQRKRIFQKLASSCLAPSLHASALQLPANIAEIIWVKIELNGRVRNLTQV